MNRPDPAALAAENRMLRDEIRVSREAAEITAHLVVEQFEKTDAILTRFQEASANLGKTNAELEAANQRLQQLDKMKSDFLSSVSHELRTPLTSIRAFSEMLHEDPRIELAERTRFLGIIVGETGRLSRLINQILDLAKLESGRADWTSVAVDLAPVIHEACASLSQLYKDKGVALTLEIEEPLPTVMADRDRLMQVMINLLSNAVKFAPAGRGRVKVGAGRTVMLDAAGRTEAALRVAVADNGPGIRPEDRETIFEKFRQGGQDVLTDKPQGTGLGLPISRQIVEYFGGRLWLEPAAAAEAGAHFVFTLPLPSGDNAEQQKA